MRNAVPDAGDLGEIFSAVTAVSVINPQNAKKYGTLSESTRPLSCQKE
jgi:hypothetical protein